MYTVYFGMRACCYSGTRTHIPHKTTMNVRVERNGSFYHRTVSTISPYNNFDKNVEPLLGIEPRSDDYKSTVIAVIL